MIPQWIIERKREGHCLSDEEIAFFIGGYAEDRIPDYQMAALAMAICLKDMSARETAALTLAMLRSGITIDSSSVQGVKIDKHSTGGVGDKISLILAPLAACCGVVVPMIAGRGLGITGGTVDKLESIPGYRINLNKSEFIGVLESCGCSITGQTFDIAPADRKLYALRDVTGTVPSIPLMVSSILSKKLAEGIDGLILDVKCGSGAFMKTANDANALKNALLETAQRMNLNAVALVTDMNQPLGRSCGNALEVIEAIETLKGNGPEDIIELTTSLCAEMLMLAGISSSREAAEKSVRATLQSGEAFSRFKKMVQLHGGDCRAIENMIKFGAAIIKHPVIARRSAYIRSLKAESIGKACLVLGAGRTKTDDAVDHSVGVSKLKKTGEWVERGEPLAIIHASRSNHLAASIPLIEEAFEFSDEAVPAPVLIAG